MNQAQRKFRVQNRPAALLEYVAAVRYPDGRRDLFHVRKATDMADARELVEIEVGENCCILIAERR